MKRIGIIDNLGNVKQLLENRLDIANAKEVMAATGGNTGNVAFVFGAKRMLGNPVIRIRWGCSPETVKKQVDHLVVCCANQLGSHADLADWADRLEQFNLPVTLIGLGTQSENQTQNPFLPDGTQRFLKVVDRLRPSNHPNVTTRGSFTQSVLDNCGIASIPAGCPSLMCSPERYLGEKIFQTQAKWEKPRVAVAAGNPWHAPSAPLERTLMDLVDRFSGDYILQHPQDMFNFAYGHNANITEQTARLFLDIYRSVPNLEELIAWYRRYSSIFVDAPNWICHLRKFDLVLGPRYHGVMLGIQAGIPGLIITIDSRTEELAETSCLKQISCKHALHLTPEDLIAAAIWTEQEAKMFDINRVAKARDYLLFLKRNEIVPSSHLVKLTEQCR